MAGTRQSLFESPARGGLRAHPPSAGLCRLLGSPAATGLSSASLFSDAGPLTYEYRRLHSYRSAGGISEARGLAWLETGWPGDQQVQARLAVFRAFRDTPEVWGLVWSLCVEGPGGRGWLAGPRADRVCLRRTAPRVAGGSTWQRGPQPLAGPAVLGRSPPVVYLSDFSSSFRLLGDQALHVSFLPSRPSW